MLNEKIYIPQNIFYFSEDLSGKVGWESSSLSLNSQLFVIIVDILVFYTFVNVGIISVFLLFFIAVEQWFGKSPIIKGENVKREGCTFQQSTNSCISSFQQEMICPVLLLSLFPTRNCLPNSCVFFRSKKKPNSVSGFKWSWTEGRAAQPRSKATQPIFSNVQAIFNVQACKKFKRVDKQISRV